MPVPVDNAPHCVQVLCNVRFSRFPLIIRLLDAMVSRDISLAAH
jgi:hypothetical protein